MYSSSLGPSQIILPSPSRIGPGVVISPIPTIVFDEFMSNLVVLFNPISENTVSVVAFNNDAFTEFIMSGFLLITFIVYNETYGTKFMVHPQKYFWIFCRLCYFVLPSQDWNNKRSFSFFHINCLPYFSSAYVYLGKIKNGNKHSYFPVRVDTKLNFNERSLQPLLIHFVLRIDYMLLRSIYLKYATLSNYQMKVVTSVIMITSYVLDEGKYFYIIKQFPVVTIHNYLIEQVIIANCSKLRSNVEQ